MDRSPTRSQPVPDPYSPQYWCHHCNKRVTIETLPYQPDVICFDCKNGFVEPIEPEHDEDPNLGSPFLQVLRQLAQSAREQDAPLPPPINPSDEEDTDDEDDEDEDDRSVEIEVREDEIENRDASDSEDNDDDDDDDDDDEEDDIDEDEMRRIRLRIRLNDFLSRVASRRDQVEILTRLDDQSIELRLQAQRFDNNNNNYVGNPGDYVNDAEYEALLRNLSEIDSSGSRGAPPAGKAAIEGLESVTINDEGEVLDCAVCKDSVNVGEVAKKLPCGHMYHGECIVPWLGSRNSCPVCRFELATDDPEYEEERKKRVAVDSMGSSSGRDSEF